MDSDIKSVYKNLENEFTDCNTLACFSRKALNVLKKTLGFERGEILIYNPELKEFELAAETGLQSGYRLSRFKINEYENPASIALLENKIVYIRNVNSDFEYFSKLYGLTVDEEVFSIPLSANGVAFGVLQFFSEKEKKEEKRERWNGIDLENLAEWLGHRIYRIIRLESVKDSVYRKLLEYAGFIAIVDNEGFILDCSTSFERILGYSHGELIGVNIKEIHKGYSANSEAILMGKNGTLLTCHESTEVIVDRDGESSGFVKIFSLDRDVKCNDTNRTSAELENKRKEALEKIKENLEYFELLADKLINPIAIIRGSIELKDEIEHNKLFSTLIQQIERINQILEEFRRREKETFRIWIQLNNRHKLHKK